MAQDIPTIDPITNPVSIDLETNCESIDDPNNPISDFWRITTNVPLWHANPMKNLPWILIILLTVLSPNPTEAQQTGARPYYVEAGGYHIGVLSKPSGLSLGTIDYIITLNDPQTTAPIPDARVLIRAVKADGQGHKGWANALNTPGNPDRYTARVELDEPGVWKMEVEISGELGHVQVEAPSQVVPKPREAQSGGLVFIGAFAAIGLGAAYVIWTIRRTQKKPDADSAS